MANFTAGNIPVAANTTQLEDSALSQDGAGGLLLVDPPGAAGESYFGVTSGAVTCYLGAIDSLSVGYFSTDAPTLTLTVDNTTTMLTLGLTNALVDGYLRTKTANALTAVGTDRATSLALSSSVNNITTAAAGTGVTLPSVATVGIGGTVTVLNAGANPIKVYGASADTIDGVAAATGVTLTNAKRCIFIAVAAATWISAQLGVPSN